MSTPLKGRSLCVWLFSTGFMFLMFATVSYVSLQVVELDAGRKLESSLLRWGGYAELLVGVLLLIGSAGLLVLLISKRVGGRESTVDKPIDSDK